MNTGNVIKYSLIWMFGLGIATIIIVPLYIDLINKIGGWIYLCFIGLGFLTEAILQKEPNKML